MALPLLWRTAVTSTHLRSAVCLALLCAAWTAALPATARAQTDNIVAVGVNVTARSPGDSHAAHGSQSIGFTWRLGHAHTGWGWDYGFGWYAADIDRTVDGQATPAGELKLHPIAVGYGYTIVMGRTTVSSSLQGGYSFNTIDQSPVLSDVYRDRLGARSVQIDTANAFIVRPQVTAWYDLSRKVGIQFSASYTVARPRITVSSSLGDDTRRIRADMLALKVGAVYSIF
jgi:hypothetical protein